MKRFKCHAPKIRTVTEIINGRDKLKKDYDLTEFDVKNQNSLESYDSLKIRMVLVKYMAMLNTLKMTQPLLTIFRDRNAIREIVTLVLASLGFVHNRVNPLVNNFDNRMEFVIVESRQTIVPGEPIVFRINENDDMVCIIDRPSIMRILERNFDVNMDIASLSKEVDKMKLMKAFSSSGRKRRRSEGRDELDYDIRLNEVEATRYLALLLIIEHAYCHYVIFKNDGPVSYVLSLTDHSLFANKCRPNMNMSFDNLLLSKMKFSLEECNSNKLMSSKAKGLLNYT
uniref:ODV-EC27 n=1 Tax=Lymantria dispar multicapsid nuclear polyhedrosis virus TaxID=10449 RepID=V9TGD8_NPVLD|nr:ODV-EC27 [Lymantria dispar multiple nucleopolyhedrovirus]AJR20289.1 odv-ec27 [Lymantria dispar multiple nucleopolyhedrovirus]AMO27516.1 ODV-EC27 [Lymantria dispar multiple nucleopolyhedrovirus]AMO27690.1 ODV-EC27 [Lymantria dispar multiple nucleopolyhedrovirus]AQQ80040.1 odv-ec27 [Lymantria dispar multiple nucleopolyhedrovirus]